MKSKVAMAFGSFDVLHPGHIRYLRSASRYGRLIVVVARDKSIEKLKGRKPLIDEESRREIIGSLRFVDRAILGDRIEKWNDIYAILVRFRPDFLVFGYDQKVDMKYLRGFIVEHGLNSRIVRVRAYNEGLFKSSKLKRLMKTIH
jgi:FAD synthetase